MSSSGYDVDPAVLKTQGAAFSDIGTGFSDAAEKLKSAVGGEPGETWGSDDFIGTFNDLYGPVCEGIVESMPHLGEALSKIGSNLTAMGTRYDLTEQDQHDTLTACAAGRPDLRL
ncbi:WXG100 family type VII secretion target [Streptomyces pinistramenti]|uniref:WXG100 family type VII secretion target n=1 Tax=Streptomyces pinistramenti TaxID=2884812 RepID=UPI001D08FB3B|nr:hypothetical protein [Streptomyces pinistramenti]MCB5911951.1 hypothetical protein [Streptomyces pinistramenti]